MPQTLALANGDKAQSTFSETEMQTRLSKLRLNMAERDIDAVVLTSVHPVLCSASDRSLALWEVNCQVHRRGLELIRPGVRCCDIAAELNAIYQDHDLLQYRTFGYGHSFGVLCHYYGREAALELREDVETVLQPGMVVSMEPMIMVPEGPPGAGGYREHDMLVLTADGAEEITRFPFGPAHNIIAG